MPSLSYLKSSRLLCCTGISLFMLLLLLCCRRRRHWVAAAIKHYCLSLLRHLAWLLSFDSYAHTRFNFYTQRLSYKMFQRTVKVYDTYKQKTKILKYLILTLSVAQLLDWDERLMNIESMMLPLSTTNQYASRVTLQLLIEWCNK